MRPHAEPYLQTRARLCNACLVGLAIACFPALAASLWRVSSIGWQPVMGLHIALAILITLVAVFRNRVPYVLRAGFIVFFFMSIGLAGIWTFGLATGSIAFLVVAPVLAAVLFSMPAGIVVLALILAGAAAIGGAMVLGTLANRVDANAYNTSLVAWVLFVVGLLLSSGALVLFTGILNRTFIDTLNSVQEHASALQASESRHRSLIDNLPQIVFSWSSTAGTLYNSPRVEDMLGYSPAFLLEHPHHWSESIHPDDKPQVEKAAEGLKHGKPFDLAYRIRDAAGQWRWVHDNTIAIHRKDDGFIVDGIITDITAQRLAEEQLRQSQKMETIGQLTGGIAHDFNNLLSIMELNAEYLKPVVDLDEEARPRLKMLRKAILRASSLTSRLTAYSRRQVLSPAPTDIAGLLSGLNDLLQHTLGETVTLRVGHLPGLWPAIVDPHQLESALINLAINARDAMPDGGLLTISAGNTTLGGEGPDQRPQGNLLATEEVIPGDYVVISVTDTGTGMPPEVLQHMFEPFYTTKDVGEGSGLGLSMVYGFVSQSRGFLTVDSIVGQGTTLRLHLPRSAIAVAEKPRVRDTVPSPRARTGQQILVVEDDPDVRAVPVLILKRAGYQVVEAANAEEALALFRQQPSFDLLFTDIVMPGKMNGVQLVKEARKLQPDLAVLFTSGYTEEAFGRTDKSGIGGEILQKPYRRKDLLERVRAALDNANA